MSTLIECIYKAVALQKEVEQNGLDNVVRIVILTENTDREEYRPGFQQCNPAIEDLSRELDFQLTNLTEFDLEHWNTNDNDQQEWIDRIKAAMSWVGEMRKVCRAVQLKAKALLEEDPSLAVAVGSELHLESPSFDISDGLNVSKETMSEQAERRENKSLSTFADMGATVEVLRERARNVRETFEELKNMKKMTQNLLTDRIVAGPKSSSSLPKSDVEGEIIQSAEEIRAARWAEFNDFKNRVTHLGSSLESTQKTQLDCIRKLDQEIASTKPPLRKLDIVPEELDQVVSTSVERWLSPGKERLLVQVEDELLKFKADYFCHLLDSLKPLLDVVEHIEEEA